jgi:ribosome-binding factor A
VFPVWDDLSDLTPALGPDDRLDPRRFHDRRTRRGGGRKALQLCEQVRHALTAALAGLGDEALQAVTVLGVEPAPHSGRLRVTVTAPDRKQAEARLAVAAGRLRTEVAAGINRRKAPELVFAVV